MLYSLKDSIFNFCLTNKEDIEISSSKNMISFGKYKLYITEATPIQKFKKDKRILLILGYAINVKTNKYNELAEEILNQSKDINDIIEYEKYMGGKYLLIYSDNNSTYILPDATASIPCCYYLYENKIMCTCSEFYIANEFKLSSDFKLEKIRKSSDISQAMPFNYTIYNKIKQLLPNHYLDVEKGKQNRFVNSKNKQKIISARIAAENTKEYIKNLTKYYNDTFKIYCPITGGKDSRVVLSFIRNIRRDNKNLECYTIKHKEFSEKEPDILIPQELTKEIGVLYKQIDDEILLKETIKLLDTVLGKDMYSKRTLMIANTVHSNFFDGAIINGDIIGQIGKCSLHRDIPEKLATAAYFRCKLHNYSKESKKLIQEWIEDIKMSKEQISLFDLFSIESRMGRWAAQENLIYNTLGQLYLNIFNSRAIIYEWTKVDRKERKNGDIHKELIRIIDMEVSKFSYEDFENLIFRLSKKNGITYYLSSRIKYILTKLIFYIKNG